MSTINKVVEQKTQANEGLPTSRCEVQLIPLPAERGPRVTRQRPKQLQCDRAPPLVLRVLRERLLLRPQSFVAASCRLVKFCHQFDLLLLFFF